MVRADSGHAPAGAAARLFFITGPGASGPPRRKVCSPVTLRKLAVILAVPVALAGCNRAGDLVEGGISAVRTACPNVSIPAGTGDITLFNPPQSREARAIDIAATLTNVRSSCNEAGAQVVTTITFDVLARRASAEGARQVTLPYFVVMMQGGSAVVSKRVGQVTLNFAPGQIRAEATGTGTTTVDRAAATLPDDVKRKLTEKRKAGQVDAAIDPLSRPEIRTAVLRATFDALVGFQLTDDQLRYNATR